MEGTPPMSSYEDETGVKLIIIIIIILFANPFAYKLRTTNIGCVRTVELILMLSLVSKRW